jgi:ankyrin repeat protein
MLQVLLKADPELAILPDMTGSTPLHLAAASGDPDLVRRILQFKPGVNERNLNLNEYSHGQWLSGEEAIMPVDKAPLHCAVESGDVEVVQLLLDAGEGVCGVQLRV